MSGPDAQGLAGSRIEAPLLDSADAVLRASSEREAIQRTGDAVHGLGWGRVRVGLFENWQMIGEAFSGHGEAWRSASGTPICWADRFALSQARFRIGRSFLAPAEGSQTALEWQDEDEAYVPIESVSGGVVGVIEMQDPVSRMRPGELQFGPVEFLGDLCARTIESLRRHEGQRLELLGRCAEGVAHDYNNILTVIRGQAAMAERALDPDHAAVGALHSVESAVQHASEMVASLLEYTRTTEFERTSLDLRALIRATVPLLDQITPSSIKVGFSADGDGDLLVQASSIRIRQLLVNLVLNAADAIEGQGRVDFSLCVVSGSRSRVRLIIRDSGVGMASDSIAVAFDRAYSSHAGGSGLGLGLVREIVHEHAGHIELTSAPGEGTTVSIDLPLLQEAERRAA